MQHWFWSGAASGTTVTYDNWNELVQHTYMSSTGLWGVSAQVADIRDNGLQVGYTSSQTISGGTIIGNTITTIGRISSSTGLYANFISANNTNITATMGGTLTSDLDGDSNTYGLNDMKYYSGLSLSSNKIKTESIVSAFNTSEYPKIVFTKANDSISISYGDAQDGSPGYIDLKQAANTILRISGQDDTVKIFGPNTAGTTLTIYNGVSDRYPYIALKDNDDIELAGNIDYISSQIIHTTGRISSQQGLYTHFISASAHNLTVTATPAGNDHSVQYNDGGTTGGDSNITWEDGNQELHITGSIHTSSLMMRNNELFIQSAGDQRFKFSGGANISKLYGGDSAGDDLYLYQNTADNPYDQASLWLDDGDVKLMIDQNDSIQFWSHETRNFFSFKSPDADSSRMYGGVASSDDTWIYANSVDTYPTLKLSGSGNVLFNTLFGSKIIFQAESNSIFQFSGGTELSHMWGGSTANDDLKIQANSTDAYPTITLQGNEHLDIDLGTNDMFRLLDTGTPYLKFWAGGGEAMISSSSHIRLDTANNIYFYQGGKEKFLFDSTDITSIIKGGEVTGDDLLLYANSIDSYPYIDLNGSGNADIIAGPSYPMLRLTGSGNAQVNFPTGYGFFLYEKTQEIGRFNGNASTFNILSNTADQDIRIRQDNGGQIEFYSGSTHKKFEFNLENSSLFISGGSIEPTKTAGTLWMSGSASNTIIYLCSSTNGNWVPLTSGSSIGGGGSSPGGNDHSIQYNNGGAMGGDSNITWEDTNKELHITGSICTSSIRTTRANKDLHIESSNDVFLCSGSKHMMKLSNTGGDIAWAGGTVAGNNLYVYANADAGDSRIVLLGQGGIYFDANSNGVFIRQLTDQIAKFELDGTNSNMYGGAQTGDDLYIYSNILDDYPLIKLDGSGSITASWHSQGGAFAFQEDGAGICSIEGDANAAYLKAESGKYLIFDSKDNSAQFLFKSGATQIFKFKTASDDSKMYGKAATTNDLYIYPNNVDPYPQIEFLGSSNLVLNARTSIGSNVQIKDGGVQQFLFSGVATTESKLYGSDASTRDLLIYANTADAHPYIKLNGLGNLNLSGSKITVSSQLQAHTISCAVYQGPLTGAPNDYLHDNADDTTTGTLTAKSFSGPLSGTTISGGTIRTSELVGVSSMALQKNAFYMLSGGSQIFKFHNLGDWSYLTGRGVAGASLRIIPGNTYPLIDMENDGYTHVSLNTGDEFRILNQTTHIHKFDTNGAHFFAETTTPTPTANFGALYTKTDNNLYFQDGGGTEHTLTIDGSSQAISGGTIRFNTFIGGTDATAAEIEELTDGSTTTLHAHSGTPSAPGGSFTANIGSDNTYGISGVAFVSSQKISGALNLHSPADYVIYYDGTNYVSVDCTDGTRYTENSAADQVIIDTWAELGKRGGGIFRTVGTGQVWKVNQPISSQSDNTTWISDHSIEFEAKNALNLPMISIIGHDYVTLDGLDLDGRRGPSTGPSQPAIKISEASHPYLMNLDIWHVNGHGIEYKGSKGVGTFHNLRIRDGNDWGIWLDTSDNTVNHCDIEGANSGGLMVSSNAFVNFISDIHLGWHARGPSIFVAKGWRNRFNNITADESGTYGIKLNVAHYNTFNSIQLYRTSKLGYSGATAGNWDSIYSTWSHYNQFNGVHIEHHDDLSYYPNYAVHNDNSDFNSFINFNIVAKVSSGTFKSYKSDNTQIANCNTRVLNEEGKPKYGIYLNEGENNQITNITAEGYSHGVFIDDEDGSSITNSNFYSCASGVVIDDGDNFVIRGCKFDTNTLPIKINNSNVVNPIVTNNDWGGCTNNPLYLGATNYLIQSNVDKDNTWWSVGDYRSTSVSSSTISGSWYTPLHHTRPAAAASLEGQMIRASGSSGEKTYIYMCVKNDADGYEWIQLGMST